MKIRKLIPVYGLFSILVMILGLLQGCSTQYDYSNSKSKPAFPMTRYIDIKMINLSNLDVHMYVNGTNGDENEKIGPGNKLQHGEERAFGYVSMYPDETYQSSARICVGQNGVTILYKKITISYSDCDRYVAIFHEDGTIEIIDKCAVTPL
jgi:hypothetical protein